MLEIIVLVAGIALAFFGFLFWKDFGQNYLRKKENEPFLEQDIPLERRPYIDFEGEEILGEGDLKVKGTALKGRVIREKHINDLFDLWVNDEMSGKIVLLRGLQYGKTLKTRLLSSQATGIVHLITCHDAHNNECVWRPVDAMREQLINISKEKGRAEAEKHAKELKEVRNSLRSPYMRYDSEGDEKEEGEKE